MKANFLNWALLWFAGLIGFTGTCELSAKNQSEILPSHQTNDSTDLPVKSKNPWEIGLLGGALFSTIEGDNTEDHSYLVNFAGGLYGNTAIFEPLGIIIELYYASMGTGFASVADSKRHLNYLVLPAMFSYEFNPGMSLGLGPYFGFLISARDEGDDFKEDITDLISPLDVGVKIGVYFQVSPIVELAVSFNRGFINTQRGGVKSGFKHYNQSVMFTTSVNLSKLLVK